MPWQYSEKTKQLFMDAVHGRPGTHLGEIDNPDGVGEHGSIACGDALRFTFRVERHGEDPLQDVITECRYLTFGCTSAIAASEALCTIVEKKRCTPLQALHITNQDIVTFLEGLPEQKIHCSVMGAEALEVAVFDWAKKRGVDLQELGIDIHKDEQEEGRLVCKCFSLTEPYLKRKIRELNLKTIADITNATKAGGACGSCRYARGGLQDLLDEVWSKKDERSPKLPVVNVSAAMDLAGYSPTENGSASPFHFYKHIEQVVEDNVGPMLAQHGGSIEVVDIKDKLVYCRFKGACAGCFGAGQTLKLLVEKTLKEQVDEQIRVIAL
jgi:NifU-like protein